MEPHRPEVREISHHENRATLDRMIAAMVAGDLETVTAHHGRGRRGRLAAIGRADRRPRGVLPGLQELPGGSPTYTVRRITGGGDHFTVEAVGDYGGEKVYVTNIIDFKDGKIVKQTDYFANAFEAPAWRSQWIERMEIV